MRDPVYPVQRRRRKSFLGRFALWTGLVACLLVVGAVFSTPWAVRHAVPEIFARYGVQASAQGGRLSLLRGELTLSALKLGESQAPALSLGEVGIGLDLRALVRGHLRVRRVRIEDAEFDPERLGSLPWRGAGSTVTSGTLPAELQFDDLRLTALSERIGSEVLISSLVARDLARLAAGGKARIELEMRIGGAPAEANAELALQGEDLTLSGRYRVDDVSLAGWTGLWPDANAELRAGTLRASGTLAGSYLGETRRDELSLNGSARVAALDLAHPGVRISGADVTWSGPLALDWPSLESAPVLRGDGAVDVERGAIEIAALEATLSDLSWQGSAQWSRGFSAEGTVRGELIELGASGAPHARATLQGLGLRLRVVQSLSPDTLSAHARDVALRRIAFTSAGADDALDGGIDRFEVDEIRAAHTGDFVIGQVRAATLWAGREGPGAAARSSLRAREVSLGGLSGNFAGELQMASAVAETIGLASARGTADLETVRVVTVGYRHPGQLGAEALDVDTVRVGAGGDDIWLEALHGEKIYRERSGHTGAALASAATLYQVGAASGSWEASRLALRDLERDPAGAVRSADVELEQFVRTGAGASWTARELRGKDVTLRGGDDASGAAELTLASLEGTQPEVGDVAASELRASDVTVAAGGARLGAARAATVSLRDVRGSRYEVHEVTAAGLEGTGAGGLHAARIDAERVAGTGSGADRLAGASLVVEELAVDAALALTAGALRLETFRYDDGDDVSVAFRAVSGERLRWSPDAALSLAAGRIAHLDVSGDAFDAVRLAQLEAGDLVWDRGVRLDAARAFAASVRGTTGVPWEALAATGHALRLRLPATLEASALQVETLRHDAQPSTWELDGFAAERIRLGGENGHRVASLRAGALELRDESTEAAFTRAEIEDLHVGGADIVGAGRVSASGFALGAGDESRPARLDVAALGLDAPRLERGGVLDLGDVVLERAALVIGRDQQDHWLLPAMPGAGAARAPGELRVRSLVTRGPARVEFFDREPKPEFRMAFSPFAFALGNLDSSLPGNQAAFQARGIADGFTQLDVSGKLVTGIDDIELEMRGRLIGAEAGAFNPYLATREPFQVTAGHGDAHTEFSVRDARLSGEARVSLSGLKLKHTRGLLSTRSLPAGQIPLNTVVRLLQDAEGNFELRFPLRADTDQPGFDFIELVGETMNSTARVTARLPGKALEGALGTIESFVALLPGLEATRYPPVGFAAGSAALEARAMEYLGALGRRLRERGDMRLRVCPVIVPGEEPALAAARDAEDALFARARAGVFDAPQSPAALAEQRAETVRRFLASQGVSPDRLLTCESSVDRAGGARPRVDIEMDRARS